jgi:hypothetical protein
MNIAVSPKALEFHQAHKARRARMAANALNVVLIEAPKVDEKMPEDVIEAVENMKEPEVVAPVFYQITDGRKSHFSMVPLDFHVTQYRMYKMAIQHIENQAKNLEFLTVFDIQRWCVAQEWEIKGFVAPAFSVSLRDLKSDARTRDVVTVRQPCMYLCRKLAGRTYPFIGDKFGGRDHSTAVHAFQKTEDQIAKGEIYLNGKPFNLDRIGEI